MRRILLDSAVLSTLTHPYPSQESIECKAWLNAMLVADDEVIIPEVVDYEVRREYLRRSSSRALGKLEDLIQKVRYLPLETHHWRLAAQLWADARNRGHITAPPGDLNIDILLAAQAQLLSTPGVQVIIATTNVRHLAPFADARVWRDI